MAVKTFEEYLENIQKLMVGVINENICRKWH